MYPLRVASTGATPRPGSQGGELVLVPYPFGIATKGGYCKRDIGVWDIGTLFKRAWGGVQQQARVREDSVSVAFSSHKG